MDPDLNTLAVDALPIAVSAFAPVLTALIKSGMSKFGQRIPDPLKLTINTVGGIALAALAGGVPMEGVVGSVVGNKARDQFVGLRGVSR